MNKPLKLAQLFLNKAAQDEALLDLIIGAPNVSDEIFGFHCQQAAEKLLKGLLCAKQIRFGKTHNLLELADLLEKGQCPLPADLADLSLLNPFAVEYRYDPFPESDPPLDRVELRTLIQKIDYWVKSQITLISQGIQT